MYKDKGRRRMVAENTAIARGVGIPISREGAEKQRERKFSTIYRLYGHKGS